MENINLQNEPEEVQAVHTNPKGGSIAYIATFIFFFFTFFFVECEDRHADVGLKVAGIDFVGGSIYKIGGDVRAAAAPPTNTWAVIAFLCVLAGAPIAILYNKKAALYSWWLGLIGTACIIILPISLYFEWKDQIGMEYVHFRFGYFAVLGCLIAATYLCWKRYNEIFR